jgi:hypothetical protein
MTNMPHTGKPDAAAVLAVIIASNLMLALEICIVITVVGVIGDVVFGIVGLFVTDLLLPAIGIVFGGGMVIAIVGALIAAGAALLTGHSGPRVSAQASQLTGRHPHQVRLQNRRERRDGRFRQPAARTQSRGCRGLAGRVMDGIGTVGARCSARAQVRISR